MKEINKIIMKKAITFEEYKLNEGAVTPKSKPNAKAKKELKGMFKLKASQFDQGNDFYYYDKKSTKWWLRGG